MTNETIQTIRSRRSCRAYKPEQITNEELEAVLGAGTYAASAMGKQSAKIVVVQDAAARETLSRMNAAIMGNLWGEGKDGDHIRKGHQGEGKIH